MQLRNNETRSVQFFYRDADGAVQFVHIPAKTTVELDDKIFTQLLKSKTQVSIMELRETTIEGDTKVTMVDSKKDAVIKEYYDTGKTKTVSLVQYSIDNGDLTIVERVKVPQAAIDQFLTENGVAVKDMPEEKKLELYDKLKA